MKLNFDGRVALVTGAGNGLGAAYAKWLARRGARVVVNNRVHPDRPSSAQAVVDEIVAAGGTAVADEHSVEKDDSGQAMVDRAIDAFRRIDIVIGNAAVSGLAEVENADLEMYRNVMDINFYGSISPLLAALPRMREQNYGRIVLTTSAVGIFGGFQHTVYGASKMAVIGFMRSLSVELRKTNVRINVISPHARTKASSHVISDDLAELMSPDKVAPVVGWLVSEQCDRTGIILSAGAGRVRRNFMVESGISQVSGEGEMDFSILDDSSSVTETPNTRAASSELVPELLSMRR